MKTPELTHYLVEIIRVELKSNDQKILLSTRGKGKECNDNNLFFTLSAARLIPKQHQSLKEKVIEGVERNLVAYINKSGRPSYNFWRTKPYEQFPNSWFFSRAKHFWIPDDLDCTALGYFFHSKNDIKALQRYLKAHRLSVPFKLGKNNYSYTGYSTWLGRKMPVEIDVCVLANYLLLLYSNSLTLTRIELGIKAFLENIITDSEWINSPFLLSPNYQKSHVISWHLTRISKFLNKDAQNQLKSDLIKFAENAKNFEEKLFTDLAFLELKEVPRFSTPSDQETIDLFIQNFEFFYASLLTNSKFKILKKHAALRPMNISFRCRGFNAALILKRIDIKE